MVRGESPGPAPACPGPGQQLAAHPVELTDMAPPEAAQEGTQGGWRLDRAAQGAAPSPGAQHIGVVNAVAPSQRGGHQRHHLVPRVRPSRRAAEVKVMVDEFSQAQVPGEGGRHEQAGIGHQAMVVIERMRIRSGLFCGSIYWVLLVSARVSVPKPLSQIQRSTL